MLRDTMSCDLESRLKDLEAVLNSDQGNVPDDFFTFNQPPLPDIRVELFDLKDVYDKVQTKVPGISEQRIAKGWVNGVAWSAGQINSITVLVRRTPEAAARVNDTVGSVELKVTYKECGAQSVNFSFNLDSAYKNSNGDPVYKLAKVETNTRNVWHLIITVQLIDGSQINFTSKEFRIRTKPKTLREPADTDVEKANKRKRFEPDQFLGGSAANPSPDSLYSGADSSPDRLTVQTDKNILTDYLEAQRTRINDLRVAKWTTEGADVAYHLNLTESSKRRPDLEEGDVIAFLTNRNTGQTEIEKLTHENSARAVLAGVISRSAYIYAHAPRHSNEKGSTETVCVIGVVKVKVVGTVQNGERIYVALHHPGVAIPETQIPLRPMADRRPVLLGQALESKSSYSQDKVQLVQCFVSIVLGIQSGQINNAIEDLQEKMQRKFEDVVVKDRSKWIRGLKWKIFIFLVIVGLLSGLLYEFLAPGTWFQYQLCKRGCIKGHSATFKYTTHDIQYIKVYGLEFTWEKLKKNKKLDLEGCQPFNATAGYRYYLNLDRCAYDERIVLDHKPPIRGPTVFAINSNCSVVYFVNKDKWQPYTSAEHIQRVPPCV